MRILHITPHLGGGVGRALACLAESSAKVNQQHHVFVCLEQPEKKHFMNRVHAAGAQVYVTPNSTELSELVEWADIVQVEWWNHPALFQALCDNSFPKMRLLVWCHVSGLHIPRIPIAFLLISDRFLLTSPCSMDASEIKGLSKTSMRRIGIVSSGGALDDFPQPRIDAGAPLSAGYIGTLTSEKLHPNFLDYLAAINIEGFSVRMIGDREGQESLTAKSRSLGKESLLEFVDFTDDVANELARINCFVYLLNPKHYGTAENALLEAMAMGVLPIVLNNPAEQCIVENKLTGLIVSSPREFVRAIHWLIQHPEERARIGCAAARSVRARYTKNRLTDEMSEQYSRILRQEKKRIDFSTAFGRQPWNWFLSCQPPHTPFKSDGSVRYSIDRAHPLICSARKGSLFHFLKYFPEDKVLNGWAKHVFRYLSLQPSADEKILDCIDVSLNKCR